MKKLILLLSLLLPAELLAVPAFNGTASIGQKTSGTGGYWTFTHTVSAGSNLELVVGVVIPTTAGAVSITGAWWDESQAGEQAMTLVTTVTSANLRMTVFKLKNPGVKTSGLGVALNGAGTNEAVAIALNYSGVDQTTDIGTAVTGTNTNTAPTVTASTAAAGDLTVAFVGSPSVGITHTETAGQTMRYDEALNGGTATTKESASDKTGASPTLSYTLNSSSQWVMIAVPLKAAASAIKPPTFILEDE